MSYGSSAIQSFTEALLASLQARIDAAEPPAGTTLVWDGPPTAQGRDRPDWIMLGDVSGDGVIELLDRTTQPRDERFTLGVVISVERQSRADQKTVNDRAFQLYDYLNQELRGNPRQGVASVMWSYSFVSSQAKRANERARECTLEAGVTVRSRI